MKKFIAFIPARRGSKRIRKKNFIRIKGLPLYKHTLNAAKKSKLISNIIISTDAKQILREKNEKNIFAKMTQALSRHYYMRLTQKKN